MIAERVEAYLQEEFGSHEDVSEESLDEANSNEDGKTGQT